MSHFDNYTTSATVAKSSFDEVFQAKKRKDVFNFCKTEIVTVRITFYDILLQKITFGCFTLLFFVFAIL